MTAPLAALLQPFLRAVLDDVELYTPLLPEEELRERLLDVVDRGEFT